MLQPDLRLSAFRTILITPRMFVGVSRMGLSPSSPPGDQRHGRRFGRGNAVGPQYDIREGGVFLMLSRPRGILWREFEVSAKDAESPTTNFFVWYGETRSANPIFRAVAGRLSQVFLRPFGTD